MDFRVLGPVEVIADDGTPLDIGPYQQRAVLAMCMLIAPRPAGPSQMIDALWEGEPPPGAVNTVQAYVSKLRRAFEPGRRRHVPPAILVTRPGGYALDIPETALDLGRVRRHADEGGRMIVAGDHEGAGRRLRLALGEWRGEPLADFADAPWAAEEVVRLAELRLTLEEDLAQADLALGGGAAQAAGLVRLIAAHPFRERLRVLGAHALYQAGRQADALAVLAEGRRLLVEDLGLDPDPRSREMERRILAQDPELTPRVRVTTGESARLVGRKAETEALDLAVTGDGHRTVLLAGEPGIGKTSLAEHAAEAARSRGHRVVWGRCWDGTGAPPFWPWTQAVQELVGRDGELAQLAGAGQFELYEAFARLLNEHGRVLVVLDDLQWADASSLRLLEFLAATRLCPRLTVVATYRDTDVRQGGALEQALGVLLRLPNVRRLLLRGLAEGEVREYLGRAGADPGRAAEMGRLTAGNPFFLGEVLQLGETPAALSDVVRGRMAGLPPETGEVLTAAALLGRNAAIDVLFRVLELPEERVLDLVDAAVGARLLVEEEGPSYRFVHDIVRDVLREALPPLRRRRLHARVAEVLEERSGTRLEEIAHHYREGLLTARTTGKAIGYTRRAAAQATAQFAHEDAVENLGQAIGLIDRLPRSDDALRCDLLLDLAEAQAAAGMSLAAHVSLEAAAEIAEGLGDDNRLARAALGFTDPIYLAMYEEMTGIDRLSERIERVLASGLAGDSPWRAQLLAAAALTGSTARPVESSTAIAREAVRLARGAGDDRTLSRALIAWEILLRPDHDHDLRRSVIDEIVEIGRRTGDLATEWVGREAEYVELNAQGRTERAAGVLTWLGETAGRLRLPSMVSLAAWQTAVHAYLGGRFADALAAADASGAAYPEGALGRDDARLRRELFRFLALRAENAPGEALALADEMLTRRPGQRPWQILRCLALIDLARPDEARAVFARLSRDDFAEIGPDLAYRFVPDAVSEICAALGDVAAGRVLYGRLAPNAGRLLGWSVTDLCLARLALLDGDERAPAHLRAAEAFVGEAGLRVYEPALRALADFHVSRVSCEPCRLGVSPPPLRARRE
ncbi:BTAD domain-containing putative transcriptional regulator [Streptosporangium lutulentum]|uniref:DNA-binding SARP family transcriptional activator n=1 Tax=Streptosporangium lutulentum TaxID=1461250 RepID=A0ABT9QHK2_9ACTN|nr:BTAD domain-containing putative transcriptional regulator [Streptosporangium lutulentum]MDP9846237.1 DNA-binding SARP family transcriptional activator [Streptosporangium lutulentum]